MPDFMWVALAVLAFAIAIAVLAPLIMAIGSAILGLLILVFGGIMAGIMHVLGIRWAFIYLMVLVFLTTIGITIVYLN